MDGCCLSEVEHLRQQALWEEAKSRGVEAARKITEINAKYKGNPEKWAAVFHRVRLAISDLRLVCTSRKSRVAGKARMTEGIVEINCWLIEDEPAFLDTALHEVAHHLTSLLFPGSPPHGREWQYVAKAMGADPRAVVTGLPREKAIQLRRGIHWIATCASGHKFHLGPKAHKAFVDRPDLFRCPHDYTRIVQVEQETE